MAVGVPSVGLGHNCKCRANGENYALGKILCVQGKLSRCELNQNVTSWKVIASICPVTSKPQDWRLAEAPFTAMNKNGQTAE